MPAGLDRGANGAVGELSAYTAVCAAVGAILCDATPSRADARRSGAGTDKNARCA